MDDFEKYLAEQLKDPEFKREWDALAGERELKNSVKRARKKRKISQKTLSEKTGIAQSDISRIENGYSNPSWETILRLAEGLGMKVKLVFEPMDDTGN